MIPNYWEDMYHYAPHPMTKWVRPLLHCYRWNQGPCPHIVYFFKTMTYEGTWYLWKCCDRCGHVWDAVALKDHDDE